MAIKARLNKTQGVTYYMIDFRCQNGHRVRETAGTTRKQAKDRLTQRLGEVKAGTFDCPKERVEELGPTFDEFADTFMKDYGSRCRSNHYEAHLVLLRAAFGKSRLREITREDLDRFAAERARAVGPSTLRKNLTVLSKVFKMAVGGGFSRHLPRWTSTSRPSRSIRRGTLAGRKGRAYSSMPSRGSAAAARLRYRA